MPDKIRDYFKNIGARRFTVMVCGVVITGLGIAFLRLALLGNDPFSGMNLALAGLTGIYYPVVQLTVNIILFIIQILFGRKYLGPGTFVNAVCLAYISDFFYRLIYPLTGDPGTFILKLLSLLLGLLITALGLSMYQCSNTGVAPYDALSLILYDRFKKIPYFAWRVSNDGTCALICFLSGGIIGLGTLVTAFGLGPCIQFFDKTITVKMLGGRDDVK